MVPCFGAQLVVRNAHMHEKSRGEGLIPHDGCEESVVQADARAARDDDENKPDENQKGQQAPNLEGRVDTEIIPSLLIGRLGSSVCFSPKVEPDRC
jgi:hypothetical protein